MRPPRRGPRSSADKAAARSKELASLPYPPGLTPLRLRLLRLCLGADGEPHPGKLEGLRNMSLREALQLEAVAHHRQREAALLADAVRKHAEEEARRRGSPR